MESHVVTAGETLSKIAQRYGVKVNDVLAINPEITNRDLIRVGQKVRIPPRVPLRIRMLFDGRKLSVVKVVDGAEKEIGRYAAISGLPAGSKAIPYVAKKHKIELDPKIDYSDPKYEDKGFAGPIPENRYYLYLTRSMKFDKSGGGWGVGGWLLKEPLWSRYFGRDGFFLHHDGGHPGTSGCIGLVDGRNIIRIQRLLRRAYSDGQREVVVEVEYDD